MSTALKRIEEAVQVARDGDYLQGLTLFLDIYGTDDSPPLNSPKAATGLSWFGLCVARVQKKFKPAVELCKRALDLEFFNGDHFANLSRVYAAAGNRKKALETAEAGLRLLPDHAEIRRARRELGVRARPPVPFLDRSNPVNVSLGQARQSKKIAEKARKKK